MTRNELIEKMAKAAWENAVESASGRSPFILSADEKARIAEAFRPRYAAEMSAAITAIEAAGYAVVPRGLLSAAAELSDDTAFVVNHMDTREFYDRLIRSIDNTRAMLAASPMEK